MEISFNPANIRNASEMEALKRANSVMQTVNKRIDELKAVDNFPNDTVADGIYEKVRDNNPERGIVECSQRVYDDPVSYPDYYSKKYDGKLEYDPQSGKTKMMEVAIRDPGSYFPGRYRYEDKMVRPWLGIGPRTEIETFEIKGPYDISPSEKVICNRRTGVLTFAGTEFYGVSTETDNENRQEVAGLRKDLQEASARLIKADTEKKGEVCQESVDDNRTVTEKLVYDIKTGTVLSYNRSVDSVNTTVGAGNRLSTKSMSYARNKDGSETFEAGYEKSFDVSRYDSGRALCYEISPNGVVTKKESFSGKSATQAYEDLTTRTP